MPAALAVSRRLVAYFPGYLARAPNDARAHILFAGCLAEVGQREQALQEADTALALGGNDSLMLYNLCCVYCRMGEAEKGTETLTQAFAAGYSNVRWALADPDLACIRQHPKFVARVSGRLTLPIEIPCSTTSCGCPRSLDRNRPGPGRRR